MSCAPALPDRDPAHERDVSQGAGPRQRSIEVASEGVRRAVRRIVGNLLNSHDPDQEDIVQIVMLELFRAQPRYRGECSPRSWIHEVTRRTVCKYIRRRALERRLFGPWDETGRAEGRSPSDVERTIVAKGNLRRVARCLGDIGADKVRALMLHCSGYELTDIAQLLGVSLAAAQTRVSRARRELRVRFEEELEQARR